MLHTCLTFFSFSFQLDWWSASQEEGQFGFSQHESLHEGCHALSTFGATHRDAVTPTCGHTPRLTGTNTRSTDQASNQN